MEQKKVLWIIAAVGVFLLVVLGTALVMYSPNKSKNITKITGAKTSDNTQVDSSGWISLAPNNAQNNGQYNNTNQGQPPIPQGAPYNQNNYNGDMQQNNGATPAQSAAINNGYTGPLPPVETPPIDTQSATASSVATINITTDSPIPPITNDTSYNYSNSRDGSNSDSQVIYNDSYRESPEVPKNTPAPAVKPVTPSVKKVTPAPKKVTPPRTAPTRKTSTKSATATSSAQVNINVKQKPKQVAKPSLYWVQVTALTSKKSADNARNVLFDNKIMADIFTYTDKSGKLFYRVRVGPYSTKTEAEYWKQKIAAIETFRNTQSYIAQTAS